ncbi:hypothetical protein F5Y06DRAFT_277021 [Hypoxylon sp. FL0890]|nr:hypothetical protein F5Y06DRAFT_277021 [Hypoxylon sp. FL0890]
MTSNAVQTTWDALPIEIQSMIIGSIMEPQELRRAWFTCRQVSLSFKIATEQYFRSQIVPKIKLAVWLSGFTGIRTNALRTDSELPCKSILTLSDFICYPQNGAEVEFREGLCGVGGSIPLVDDQAAVPFQQVEILMDRWLPYHTRRTFLWGESMRSYINRIAYGKPQGPSLHRCGLLFELPYMDHVSVDYEEMKVTMPYSPMISGLISQEIALREEINKFASEDLERICWCNNSSPSVERGLRIALRSDAVRLARFLACMVSAMEKVKERRVGGCGIRCVASDLEDMMVSWYQEWVRYVSS